MKITKKKLDDIKRCYCASSIHMAGEHHILYASEDPDVLCEMFSGREFEKKETIWKEAGGCMSIIPIPGKEGEFLAVQEFYLKVSPSRSKIVWGKYTENGFVIRDVLSMPYIHRFDIYHKNGVNYFIGATIATSKQNKEDWSVPGRIYVGELPDDLNEGIQVEVLLDGLYRNHGYYRGVDGCCGYFGSDQGIVKVTPPDHLHGQWHTEFLMSGHIGEIAVLDIDGDGDEEIMTIEPFHGTEIHIYKKIAGAYQRVYTYAHEIEFAHTLVGGTLRGVPSFLAGVRRKNAELFCVQYIDGKFVTTQIDQGAGPANLCLVNEENRDLIVAANHTANEAAVYIVED
ncbi:hypothetical protein MKC73_14465 [[Clostridium] innocuum]|nr:hypothetical protein [[Clostridium] innocuum]